MPRGDGEGVIAAEDHAFPGKEPELETETGSRGRPSGGYHDVVRECADKAHEATLNLEANVLKRAREALETDEAREGCLEAAAGQGLLVVGGEAIDRSLPGGSVYQCGEHRDADFVTRRSSKLVAATLMGILRDRGLPASIHPALHEGTWSVRVHRKVVADVTEIAPWEMDVLAGGSPGPPRRRLRSGSRGKGANRRQGDPPSVGRAGPGGRKGQERRGAPASRGGPEAPARFGPPVAPIEYLKMSLHLELSRPTSNSRRWPKVYRRMRSLYEAYPPAAPRGELSEPQEERDDGIRGAAHSAAKATSSDALLCGVPAALEVLGRPLAGRTDVVIVSEDPADTICKAIAIAKAAERSLGGMDIASDRVLLTQGPAPQGLFLPPYSSVTDVHGEELVRVYGSPLPVASSECGSLASADAILYLMYGEMLSLGLDPARTSNLVSASASLAEEMLAREDAGDCSGKWRRMVTGPSFPARTPVARNGP